MFVQPSWMHEQRLSFGRSDFETRLIFGSSFRYPLPKFIDSVTEQQPNRWTCENGWQLLWAGANCNEDIPYTMVQLPPRVAATYTHYRHKICKAMKRDGNKPNAMTPTSHWGEDIAPYVPPEARSEAGVSGQIAEMGVRQGILTGEMKVRPRFVAGHLYRLSPHGPAAIFMETSWKPQQIFPHLRGFRRRAVAKEPFEFAG